MNQWANEWWANERWANEQWANERISSPDIRLRDGPRWIHFYFIYIQYQYRVYHMAIILSSSAVFPRISCHHPCYPHCFHTIITLIYSEQLSCLPQDILPPSLLSTNCFHTIITLIYFEQLSCLPQDILPPSLLSTNCFHTIITLLYLPLGL